MLKALGAWLLMLLLAIANGAARDLCYGQYLGELTRIQLSTIIAAVAAGRSDARLMRRYPPPRGPPLLLGLFWAGLTVTFEVHFFPRRRRRSWKRLFASYQLNEDSCGRCWCVDSSRPIILADTDAEHRKGRCSIWPRQCGNAASNPVDLRRQDTSI